MTALNFELGLPPAHVVKGAQTLVVAPDGSPLPSDAASALLQAGGSAIPPTFSFPQSNASSSLASEHLGALSSPETRAIARMTEIGAGLPLEEISARWWGFGRACGGTDGAPAGGYSAIISELAAQITTPSEIRRGEVVVGITKRADDMIEVSTESGAEAHAFVTKSCICTIPLGVLKASPPTFTPPMDREFLSAIERTSVGTLEKVILTYDTPSPWWPERTSHGTYILLPSLEVSPGTPFTSLQNMCSRTTLAVSNMWLIAAQPHPSLLIYVGAAAGKYLSTLPASEVADALHSYIVSRLVPQATAGQIPRPTKVSVTSWLTDPFSRGATSSPVGLLSADGVDASPLDFITLSRSTWGGALGFAGEHTDLDGRGSVVGAVVSGKREAERVATFLGLPALKQKLT
ncbi:hypothetical protein DL93DRAFT_2077582 [Clavulina sp. PMI_390]|nr:hypothetical protein DL93DRAFT_2077582 [Clavulina sp. PMI_390]